MKTGSVYSWFSVWMIVMAMAMCGFVPARLFAQVRKLPVNVNTDPENNKNCKHLSSSTPETLLAVDELLAEKKFDEAFGVLLEYQKKHPDDYGCYTRLVSIYQERQDRVREISMLVRVLELIDCHGWGQEDLRPVQVEMRDRLNSVSPFHKTLQSMKLLLSDDMKTMVEKELRKGSFASALNYLSDAISADPWNEDLRVLYRHANWLRDDEAIPGQPVFRGDSLQGWKAESGEWTLMEGEIQATSPADGKSKDPRSKKTVPLDARYRLVKELPRDCSIFIMYTRPGMEDPPVVAGAPGIELKSVGGGLELFRIIFATLGSFQHHKVTKDVFDSMLPSSQAYFPLEKRLNPGQSVLIEIRLLNNEVSIWQNEKQIYYYESALKGSKRRLTLLVTGGVAGFSHIHILSK